MKNRLLYCLGLAALVLAGCGENAQSQSSSNETEESSSYSFPETPVYDEPSFQIHYLREDYEYAPWCLWLWADGMEGGDYEFNGGDGQNGAIAAYTFSELGIDEDGVLNFIVKNGRGSTWNGKDVEGDRSIDFSAIEEDGNDVKHVYLKTGDSYVYDSPEYTIPDMINTAFFSTPKRLIVRTSNKASQVEYYRDGDLLHTESGGSNGMTVFEVNFEEEMAFESEYTVKVTFVSGTVLQAEVDKSMLYSTDLFNDLYYYDGDDLGFTFDSEKAHLAVWSPFSESIEMRIYDSGTPVSLDPSRGDDSFSAYSLVKGEKGVWRASLDLDKAIGKYYTLFVKSDSHPSGIEIVDPYAKGAGINGLRGFIPDFDSEQAKPEGWDEFAPTPYDRKELVVYEAHIADITSSSTWTSDPEARKLEKTYAGAILPGTVYQGADKAYPTGFDHIKSLGVNAIQLLPIFDQANEEAPEKRTFNWGYNPLNYNVVEGVYSSDPYDGYVRIKEFRELVKAYGEEGINVIMDVVYNHVNGALGSNFDVLAPKYYFRYSNGSLTSDSGCGNDVASENKMVAKFIADSIAFWAKEYKLGGFRFDLMGLITVEAMNAASDAAKEVNPDIVIYGEPWKMGSVMHPLADQSTMADWDGYGGFSDSMRDALIKGGLAAVTELGWATNPRGGSATDAATIASGIKGLTGNYSGSSADKTVNYVSCHDNYTLYDRVYMSGTYDEELLRKMPVLANSVALLSQGTSFMLSGEEFLRSKDTGEVDEEGHAIKDGNSYASSYEVNELDYSLLEENEEIVDIYRKLIALKTSEPGLHLTSAEVKESGFAAEVTSSGHQIGFEFAGTDGRTYKVIHNDGASEHDAVDLSGYTLYLDTLNSGLTLSSSTPMERFQTVVAYK